ncbi:hypothetical protein [Pseudomonas nitroreducens]|uniref:hypothetical protein n=1 Tax=Pseudomonas nitroreducens TaxID=46680 RepID=UPI00265A8838|nr:hypothetical protein [Pseudomonas nitroreducens]MCP1650095.1 hypothetical protein [Pseudomonas nitroreducens]MCP1688036.1 hypothetical protein [Pseudomonas nitroreducens]
MNYRNTLLALLIAATSTGCTQEEMRQFQEGLDAHNLEMSARDYVVVKQVDDAIRICKEELPQVAVNCVVDGIRIGPEAKRLPYGTMVEKLTTEERLAHAQIGNVLVLTTQTTEHGFKYFTATGYSTLSISPEKKEFERFIGSMWVNVQVPMNIHRPGEEVTASFLYRNDANAPQINAELQRKAELEARNAKLQADQQAYDNSDEGRAEAARNAIVACQEEIQDAKQQIADDDRIAKVSGVRNLSVRHEAGQRIINCQDDMKVYWKEYKQFGGKERTMAELLK